MRFAYKIALAVAIVFVWPFAVKGLLSFYESFGVHELSSLVVIYLLSLIMIAALYEFVLGDR